jgi:hypothetical protein
MADLGGERALIVMAPHPYGNQNTTESKARCRGKGPGRACQGPHSRCSAPGILGIR